MFPAVSVFVRAGGGCNNLQIANQAPSAPPVTAAHGQQISNVQASGNAHVDIPEQASCHPQPYLQLASSETSSQLSCPIFYTHAGAAQSAERPPPGVCQCVVGNHVIAL